MDKSWCFPSFYETLASKLRNLDTKKFDSCIGLRIEEYLDSKLSEKGIISNRGEYSAGIIQGECDLVIETDDTIILIEAKKKVLTRNAKSGDDISIILDLADSLLSSQLQAGKTEILLRENEYLQLKDRNGKIYDLVLNGRNIERISMTQLEFGGFQDRTVLRQLLLALITHNFGTYSSEPTILKKFKKLEKKQIEWRTQYQELTKYYSRYKFFNCWFLSLAQLLEIINRSEDSNSIMTLLKSMRSVTTGSLDFYKELLNGINMKRINETNTI
jgi:hypothetical protein